MSDVAVGALAWGWYMTAYDHPICGVTVCEANH